MLDWVRELFRNPIIGPVDGQELPPEESEGPEPDVRSAPQPTDPTMPRNFGEVVGQAGALSVLRAEVQSAKAEGRMPPHVMLYGPPGTGKSMLGHVLAAELGASVYESTGAEFPTQREVMEALGRIGELQERTGLPTVWLLDEADGMTRIASYPIHGLMTSGFVTWRGQRYGGLPVMIVATTNRAAGVPRALRSRFAYSLFVDFYTTDELAEIVRRAAVRAGFELWGDVAEWIGANAAGEPRKALHLLRSIRTLRASTPEEAKAALGSIGLMHKGLSRPQRDYLQFLRDVGAAGLNTLASYLALDPKDIQGEVEPYLIRSRMATIGRGGRAVTERGLAYLVEAQT